MNFVGHLGEIASDLRKCLDLHIHDVPGSVLQFLNTNLQWFTRHDFKDL